MLQPLQDVTLKAALPDAAPRPFNTFPPLPDPWDAAHQDREKQGELRGNPPEEVHDLIRRYDNKHAGGQHHARSDPYPNDTSVYYRLQGDLVTDKIRSEVRHPEMIVRRINKRIHRNQRDQCKIQHQRPLSAQLYGIQKNRHVGNQQIGRVSEGNHHNKRRHEINQINRWMVAVKFHLLFRPSFHILL